MCSCMQLMQCGRRAGGSAFVYSRISSLQSTCEDSHMHTGRVCVTLERVGESWRVVGWGGNPERKALVRSGTMVAMDTTAGRGAPACRASPPSGEVALRSIGGGLAHCLLTHTDAMGEKKRVVQLRPRNRPSSFTPHTSEWGSRCAGQIHTSFTQCFSNPMHHFPNWKKVFSWVRWWRVGRWALGSTGTFYCLPTSRNFLFSCSNQLDFSSQQGKVSQVSYQTLF